MYNNHSNSDNPFTNNYGFNNNHCGEYFKQKFQKFGQEKRLEWKEKMQHFFAGKKAANIIDNGDSFIIELYAAGLNKADFKVFISNDVLTIQYTNNTKTETKNYVYNEYQPVSFERKFQLNGKVLSDNISASYTDGVLRVSLYKNPETNQPEQEITVE